MKKKIVDVSNGLIEFLSQKKGLIEKTIFYATSLFLTVHLRPTKPHHAHSSLSNSKPTKPSSRLCQERSLQTAARTAVPVSILSLSLSAEFCRFRGLVSWVWGICKNGIFIWVLGVFQVVKIPC